MPATIIVHEDDPVEVINKLAGDLDEIEVFNNQVLIGVYQRPKESKTTGGVILTHHTTDEDKYQSKVGVILRMGPKAFIPPSADSTWFADQDMDEGDWVVFRPSDGWSLTLISKDENGKKQELLCRMVDDTAIRAKIESPMGPDRVY